jgi:hypothetical protein
MARSKPIDMSPKFIPVDFARQILPGSFEYALCHLIDREIDLSELEARYRNDEIGTPAYAPALLLKIVLLGYSRGIVSPRAIGAACRHNVLFMTVSGDAASAIPATPDRTSTGPNPIPCMISASVPRRRPYSVRPSSAPPKICRTASAWPVNGSTATAITTT